MMREITDLPPISAEELTPEDLQMELDWRDLHKAAQELRAELPASYPEEARPDNMTVPFIFGEPDLERLLALHQGKPMAEGERPSKAPEKDRNQLRGRLSRRLRRVTGLGVARRYVGEGLVEWRGDEAAELELSAPEMRELIRRLRAPAPEPALSDLI